MHNLTQFNPQFIRQFLQKIHFILLIPTQIVFDDFSDFIIDALVEVEFFFDIRQNLQLLVHFFGFLVQGADNGAQAPNGERIEQDSEAHDEQIINSFSRRSCGDVAVPDCRHRC
jgi:hypothetical protein